MEVTEAGNGAQALELFRTVLLEGSAADVAESDIIASPFYRKEVRKKHEFIRNYLTG